MYERHSYTLLVFAVLAPCSPAMLNCSRPDSPALLEALRPVFNLSSIRPVQNVSTMTNVVMDFTLFGILGLVRRNRAILSWDTEIKLERLSASCDFVPYTINQVLFSGWESPTAVTLYLATLGKYTVSGSIISVLFLFYVVAFWPKTIMILLSTSIWHPLTDL